MTSDTWLAIGGVILGLVGLGVSVFAIIDNRRQRKERERAVIGARAVLERVYGLLVGLKPAVVNAMPSLEGAINDGIGAINSARPGLAKL